MSASISQPLNYIIFVLLIVLFCAVILYSPVYALVFPYEEHQKSLTKIRFKFMLQTIAQTIAYLFFSLTSLSFYMLAE